MDVELKARTAAGARMVALAEEHAADFATRAAEHDRENRFVAENFDLMKKSGFLAASAPEEFGGLGVESIHDITVAISRLARGCGSSAIAANMHIGAVWVVARSYAEAVSSGDAAVQAGFGQFLPILGKSLVVISGAGTETGAAFVFPQTTATPVEGGYLINGHRIFATNSEIADSVTVILKVPDGDGWYRMATAIVLRGSPGMDVRGNWDAMGMRGSGSHDVVFTDCFVPDGMLFLGNALGEFGTDGWLSVAATNFPLIGAFLFERWRRLPRRQRAVPHVPRRPCRTLHAATLAQRGVRVHRARRPRPRARRRDPRAARPAQGPVVTVTPPQ